MRFFSVDWLAALLVLAVLTAVPWLFGSGYIIGVMTVALCFAMWAASWDFMSGLTGRENFGHSLFIGAGAYTAGFLNVNFGVNPWWSLLAAPLVAVAFSLAVGFPTLRLRGPYFALAMLSGAAVMQNLTIIFSGYTGGQDGLNGLDPIVDSTLAYYYLTLILLVTTTIVLKSLAGLSPHRIVNRGLARTFQLARPFLGMTALENVEVACLAPRVRHAGHPRVRAQAWLDQVGLDDKAELEVDALPYGDLRRLEIARALATRPKLLLLDEPFAGLGVGEIEPLAALIKKLHRSEGLTILIIEHKLREFMQLVESVIAMDFGQIIAIGDPSAIVRHPRVVEAYMGNADLGLPNIEPTGAGDGAA